MIASLACLVACKQIKFIVSNAFRRPELCHPAPLMFSGSGLPHLLRFHKFLEDCPSNLAMPYSRTKPDYATHPGREVFCSEEKRKVLSIFNE